jgi:hypothetical protein
MTIRISSWQISCSPEFSRKTHSKSRGDADDSLVGEDEGHRFSYGFPTQQEVIVRAQLRGLNEHTREFSKRQLTRDTDTLLALQDIFGLYAQTKKLYLLHGLPMWVDDIAGSRPGAQITFDDIVSILHIFVHIIANAMLSLMAQDISNASYTHRDS